VTPLAIGLGIGGLVWGFVADRIATRWPEHDEEHPPGRPIDWRTLVVVVVGGLSLGSLAGRFADPVPLAVFGLFFTALVLLLATDLDQRLLPDLITLPLVPLGGQFSIAGLNPLVPQAELLQALAAAVVLPAGLYALSIPFGPGAIALGDLKLMVSVGLIAGFYRAFVGLVWGALLSGIVVAVLLVGRRLQLHTFIPFGPFLIVGAMLGILRI
jgi:leader peptidase (prepilin peptidase)/N-methyltransferase